MSELMSQAEFVEINGSACPNCGSGDMEGGSWDSDGGSVWQRVECLSCRSAWTEVFELVRFDDFEKQLELI
jgi:hypothetical protein